MPQNNKTVFLSVIIPAYNEEGRLLMSLPPTIDFLKKQGYTSEIIIVSDGSSDRTKEVAESFQNDFPFLKVIEYFPNHGKGFAVKTGMLSAKGEFRIFMDADYAIPIDYLTAFISKIIEGKYEIVIASRELADSAVEVHQPFFRELAARTFGKFQNWYLRLPTKDTQCGFKLFTKQAAEELFRKITFDCAYFDPELLFIADRLNMKIKEFGVRWRHDRETRLPIGLRRAIEITKKMFMISYIHRDLKTK